MITIEITYRAKCNECRHFTSEKNSLKKKQSFCSLHNRFITVKSLSCNNFVPWWLSYNSLLQPSKMILHRIDYNGGDIWADLTATRVIGSYYTGQGFAGMSVFKWSESQFKSFPDHKGVVVAQSTNLSLPNIPYVEIEENVKELAEHMSKIIQSLKPKVVSIEVEMIQKGCCWNNPANCICEHKGENMRNNGFNGKLYDPIPVTYTKGGKTFVKVKKVNYES